MLHGAAARNAAPGSDVDRYQRHRPEQTLLYRIVEQYYPAFTAHLAAQGRELPGYVQREFDDYLKCGRLEHGFLRARCDTCHAEHLVAFSCKRRGFCPSCGARRMAESAALLVDEVLPEQPMRQWVLSFPYPLRFLMFEKCPVGMRFQYYKPDRTWGLHAFSFFGDLDAQLGVRAEQAILPPMPLPPPAPTKLSAAVP